MTKKLVILALIGVAVMASAAMAASIFTQINFNVPSVLAFTLTLPGQSAVLANSTVNGTTLAMEFNTTTGDETNINPNVVGGSVQNATIPIFEYENTGTVNLTISVVLNATTQSCINLTGATTYAGSGTGSQITTAPVQVITEFAPYATQDWFMQADFINCTAYDTSSRNMTSVAVQS